MRLGDIGREVSIIQDNLIKLGFLKPEDKERIYGIKTKRAVMSIQRALNYRETGVWEEDYFKIFMSRQKRVDTDKLKKELDDERRRREQEEEERRRKEHTVTVNFKNANSSTQELKAKVIFSYDESQINKEYKETFTCPKGTKVIFTITPLIDTIDKLGKLSVAPDHNYTVDGVVYTLLKDVWVGTGNPKIRTALYTVKIKNPEHVKIRVFTEKGKELFDGDKYLEKTRLYFKIEVLDPDYYFPKLEGRYDKIVLIYYRRENIFHWEKSVWSGKDSYPDNIFKNKDFIRCYPNGDFDLYQFDKDIVVTSELPLKVTKTEMVTVSTYGVSNATVYMEAEYKKTPKSKELTHVTGINTLTFGKGGKFWVTKVVPNKGYHFNNGDLFGSFLRLMAVDTEYHFKLGEKVVINENSLLDLRTNPTKNIRYLTVKVKPVEGVVGLKFNIKNTYGNVSTLVSNNFTVQENYSIAFTEIVLEDGYQYPNGVPETLKTTVGNGHVFDYKINSYYEVKSEVLIDPGIVTKKPKLSLQKWFYNNYSFKEALSYTDLTDKSKELLCNFSKPAIVPDDTSMEYFMGGYNKSTSYLSINDKSDMIEDLEKYREGSIWGAHFIEKFPKFNIDTSNIADMASAFSMNYMLKELDLSNFNTSKVENFRSMFYECFNLENLNINNFKTSNVKNMACMFRSCRSLKEINVSGFDTSNVTNMSFMFAYCDELSKLDLSNFKTSNVRRMGNMFDRSSNLTSLNVSSFDTSNVEYMESMFYGLENLEELDVSHFDTSKTVDISSMFYNCNKLKEIEVFNWDVSKVKDMSRCFTFCMRVTDLDVSKWDTSSVINMQGIFEDCTNLSSIDVSNWDVSKVKTMNNMFSSCDKIISIDVLKWKTSNLEDVSFMFSNCNSLKDLDLNSFDTSKVTSMDMLIYGCSSLDFVDFSKFNTSNVKNLVQFCGDCWNLKRINLTSFDTSKATRMGAMFIKDRSLVSLDISNFNTSRVYEFTYLFIDKYLGMFEGCSSLKYLDISNFSFESLKEEEKIQRMFTGCTNLEYVINQRDDLAKYPLFLNELEKLWQEGNTKFKLLVSDKAYNDLKNTKYVKFLDFVKNYHIERNGGAVAVSLIGGTPPPTPHTPDPWDPYRPGTNETSNVSFRSANINLMALPEDSLDISDEVVPESVSGLFDSYKDFHFDTPNWKSKEDFYESTVPGERFGVKGYEFEINPYRLFPTHPIEVETDSTGQTSYGGSEEVYEMPEQTVTAKRISPDLDQFVSYLENLNTGTKVMFFSRPDSVSDNMQASFEAQTPKSRTSPIQAYANSGPHEISFSVIIHQDYLDGKDLRTVVKQLQANVLPIDQGGYITPPRSRLVIGNFIEVVGICTSVSVDWNPPYHTNNVYNQANVSFSFTEVEEEPTYADEWEKRMK